MQAMADKSSSGGVGITGLLGVLFIGLKLGNVIHWSWLWVLSPFWIPLAVVLIVFGGIFAFGVLATLLRKTID